MACSLKGKIPDIKLESADRGNNAITLSHSRNELKKNLRTTDEQVVTKANLEIALKPMLVALMGELSKTSTAWVNMQWSLSDIGVKVRLMKFQVKDVPQAVANSAERAQ